MKYHGVKDLKGGFSTRGFLVQATGGTRFVLHGWSGSSEINLQLVTETGYVCFSATLAFQNRAAAERFRHNEIAAGRASEK